MIHSVRELLWKGIGKSCFHCLRKTKHDSVVSIAEETQFERLVLLASFGNMFQNVVTYTQMLLQRSAWYWTQLQIPERTYMFELRSDKYSWTWYFTYH